MVTKTSNRDNFNQKVRTHLALQANHECSYHACQMPTSGPGDASLSDVVTLGVAAHIYAAAPGGPRYDASMTAEERSSPANGIWLCPTHATLIDRAISSHSVESLKKMKTEHLQRVAHRLFGVSTARTREELFAIGPDLLFTGELIGIAHDEWKIQVRHFIAGSISDLMRFAETVPASNPLQNYVLSNEVGDGRLLSAPPSIERVQGESVVICRVRPSCKRASASELGASLALNDANDLFLVSGDLAIVSGVDALPQKIKTVLSMQMGESPFHPGFGARFQQVFAIFSESPWLRSLIKLEVIRHASIPFADVVMSTEATPLACVNEVIEVDVLTEDLRQDWRQVRFKLNVQGVGLWERVIPIFFPTELPLQLQAADEQ